MRERSLLFILLTVFVLLISCNGEVKPSGDTSQTEYQVLYVIEGNIEETDTILKGSLIKDPYSPTKEYYKFYGWYKDSSYTTLWDFSKDTVDEHIVLYGRWELIGVKFVNEKGDYYIWSDDSSRLVEYCVDGIVRRTIWTYNSSSYVPQYIVYVVSPGHCIYPVKLDEKTMIYTYSDMISQTQLYFYYVDLVLFTRVDE